MLREPNESRPKIFDPVFLAEQFRLPSDQWSEDFRLMIEEKSRENQRVIQEVEQSLEGSARNDEQVPRSPEVLREETFLRYMNGLGFTESDLKDKRLMDLGCFEGQFVESLRGKDISQEAYGLDAQSQQFPKGSEGHFFQGNFQEELPVKNLDYIVSVGAVSSSFSDGGSLGEVERMIDNYLISLNDGGEIRIFPIMEARGDSDLEGAKKSWRNWNELALRISDSKKAECHFESRAIKVIGKNNDVILDSVLIIKKGSFKKKKPNGERGLVELDN